MRSEGPTRERRTLAANLEGFCYPEANATITTTSCAVEKGRHKIW